MALVKVALTPLGDVHGTDEKVAAQAVTFEPLVYDFSAYDMGDTVTFVADTERAAKWMHESIAGEKIEANPFGDRFGASTAPFADSEDESEAEQIMDILEGVGFVYRYIPAPF